MSTEPWGELLAFACFLVFVCVLTLILTTFALLRRHSGAVSKGDAVGSSRGPIGDNISQVDLIARITKRFCPQCRAPLAADAPEGLCPACLLGGGFENDRDAGVALTSSPIAAASLTEEVERLQAVLPQLEILELLGRGGMGTVYKARQRHLDRVVALKVIPPEAAADPAFAERFNREARAMARLNHSNIVTVHDFGQAGSIYYLVMEYIDGVNLRQTLQAGRLTPSEALAIVPQICDALQYAHDQGVVHRDIKPENVLLDRQGRIKIADFGLAKLLGKGPDDFTLTRTQQVMGTPRYMAPEQMEHSTSVDHRADIYSLGVVIYEMLTGELPVGRFALPSERVEVDVKIDHVVLRALEKEPQKRYQNVSEVKTDLASAASWPTPSGVSVPLLEKIPLNAPRPIDREAISRRVQGPAIGLMAVGSLGLLPALIALIVMLGRLDDVARLMAFVFPNLPAGSVIVAPPLPMAWTGLPVLLAQRGWEAPRADFAYVSVFFIGLTVVSIIPSLLILVGALQMRRLKAYGLAMIAAVMAMLPCTAGWFIGLPIGIWALVVLLRPDVREAFDT